MNQQQKDKESKIVVIGIIGFLFLVCIAFILYGVFVLGPDEGPNDGYHIGDTIVYDNADIVVTAVYESPYSGEHFNGYTLRVDFSITNNGSEDFNFDLDDIYIKTEDRDEKYERVVYLDDSFLFDESIIPGGTFNYTLSYRVPYSIEQKNYIIYFDLKFLHSISQCKLYNR